MSRKCKFNSEWTEKKPFLKRASTDNDAFCTLCKKTFSIGNRGLNQVLQHEESKLHKDKIREKATTVSLTSFMVSPNSSDDLVTATEVTFAYHSVKHHQSFRSNDCINELFPILFSGCNNGEKYRSGRTKTTAIVTDVLAPESVRDFSSYLKQHRVPYSLATDASNHGNQKMFALLVQYYDVNEGIQNKALDFHEMSCETAEEIYQFIKKSLLTFGLDPQLCVAFSADNAPVNFGNAPTVSESMARNNVYHKLKSNLAPNVVRQGCPAHILHNACSHAANVLAFDLEVLVLKMNSHFNLSTSRVARFNDVCEILGVQSKKVMSHSKTRWLSLLPALERVLQQYAALKSYFLSLSPAECPKVLRDFFNSDDNFGEIYLLFLHSILPLFDKAIRAAEGKSTTVAEMYSVLSELRNTLRGRKQECFVGFLCRSLLQKCTSAERVNAFKKEVDQYYTIALEYIERWFDFSGYTSNLDWLNLQSKEDLSFENLISSIESLGFSEEFKSEFVNDSLFDELVMLKEKLDNLVPHWEQGAGQSTSEKWSSLLKGNSFPALTKVVALFLSIPSSNAMVERVFSLMDIHWTDERNRLSPRTLKAILEILVNYDSIPCKAFYEKVRNNHSLLQKARQSTKYHFNK